MGEFSSDDHYSYYCGQESLKRNGVAIMVNKRIRNAVFGRSLKNNRMISVRFQGKPFSITVIQVYALTSNSPGKNTGVHCHFFLQEIFPTHESNPGHPHCRWILYHLSYQGSALKIIALSKWQDTAGPSQNSLSIQCPTLAKIRPWNLHCYCDQAGTGTLGLTNYLQAYWR